MIFVCILTHNRLSKTLVCFDSILPAITNRDDCRLVVTDQNSTDGTAPYLLRLARTVGTDKMYLRLSGENHYAIGGRQRQVEHLLRRYDYPGGDSDEDIVIFLDDDVIASRVSWMNELIAPLYLDEKIGMVGVYGRNISEEWAGFEETDDLPGYVDLVSGGMTAVRMRVFEKGVRFDEKYLPFWHGDTDLAFAVAAKGYSIYCNPDVGLEHEAEHKEPDSLYWTNWEILKKKWQGKGVVACERVTNV